MWLRTAFSPSSSRPQGSSPTSVAERALLVSLSRPRSRSRSPQPKAALQSAPRLHPAQSARSHWPRTPTCLRRDRLSYLNINSAMKGLLRYGDVADRTHEAFVQVHLDRVLNDCSRCKLVRTTPELCCVVSVVLPCCVDTRTCGIGHISVKLPVPTGFFVLRAQVCCGFPLAP